MSKKMKKSEFSGKIYKENEYITTETKRNLMKKLLTLGEIIRKGISESLDIAADAVKSRFGFRA